MNVLHVVTALGVGGVERLLLALARGFPRDGERFEVAFLKGRGELRSAFEARGVRVHALDAPHLAALPGAARRLRALLRERRCDVVHSHLLQGDLVATLATRRAFPHLRAQHNTERALERASVRWVYRRLLAGRAPLIVPTQVVAEQLIARCGEPRAGIHIVPYGLEPPRAEDEARWARERAARRAEWGLREGERAALVLARLAPQKGQLALLRALRALTPTPRWVWIFAGAASRRSELRALQRELRGHPWRAAVRLVGPSPEPELCLRSADALAVPSLWEGFGLVALEALAAGTPVVAHDLPVLREVLAGTALYVPPVDASAWMAALRSIDEDPAATAARVRAGCERAAHSYSLPRYAATLRGLYREVLHSR